MSQLRGKRALESAQTEASLAARARAGDAGALERLAGAHPDRLFAVLLRLPGDRSEAQDAARDILLRACQGNARFHGRSSFFTWLYRTAVNLNLRDLDPR